MDITSISRTIVVLNVVGSNPTSHPKKKDFPSGNPFLMPLYRTPRYKRTDRCSLAKTSVTNLRNQMRVPQKIYWTRNCPKNRFFL